MADNPRDHGDAESTEVKNSTAEAMAAREAHREGTVDHSKSRLLSAVGSLSTAVAAIIAVFTLLVTVSANDAELQRASAAEIRRDMNVFLDESRIWRDELLSKDVFVLATAALRDKLKELQQGSSPSVPAEAAWELTELYALQLFEEALVTVSHSTNRDESLYAVMQTTNDFSGHLDIIGDISFLYYNITRAVYSVTDIEYAVETIVADARRAQQGMPGAREVNSQAAFRDATYQIAQSFSKLAICRLTGLEPGIEILRKFSRVLVPTLSSLSDVDLLRLAQDDQQPPRSTTTVANAGDDPPPTVPMKNRLDNIVRMVGPSGYDGLSAQADTIAQAISGAGWRVGFEECIRRAFGGDSDERGTGR